MSGWQTLVQLLGKADRPLSPAEIEEIDPYFGNVSSQLGIAQHRGLVTNNGGAHRHGGSNASAYWYLTPLGVRLFENRVAWRVMPYRQPCPYGGRPRGTVAVPTATWLAALPQTNEIRL